MTEERPISEETQELSYSPAGAWITESFLQNLIRGNPQQNLKVTQKKISLAVAAGNNYLSTLLRVTVKYEEEEGESDAKEKTFIIKSYPTNALSVRLVKQLKLFERELFMYNDVLPKMKKILRRYTDDQFFAPRAFQCDLPDTLPMEDLVALGYKMVDRSDLLDFDHLSLVFKTLARFHALSLAVKEREPETFSVISKWGRTMNVETRNSLKGYVEKKIETHIQCLKKLTPKWERFKEVLEKYGEDAIENMAHILYDRTPGFMEVLCHGDAWLSNIMFYYGGDGKLAHVKMVDYQTCRMVSPAYDIIHILFTSAKPEVLSEMHRLISVYHAALLSDTRLFGTEEKVFTLDEFRLELRRKSGFALHVILMLLPNVLVKNEEVLDFDKIDMDGGVKDEDDPVHKIYSNPKYLYKFEQFLTHFELFLTDEKDTQKK